MKAIALLLLTYSICLAQNYRLIGTNLYDFSAARPANEDKGLGAYHLLGKVTKTYPKSLQVELFHGERLTFVPDPINYSTTGTPSDNLRALARIRMGAPTSPGQALAMGLPGEFVPVAITSKIHLLNHEIRGEGSVIDCFAVPIAKDIWDCGVPFTGSITNYRFIHRVLPYSIRIDSQFTTGQDNNPIKWQLLQATNGYARYQFEVGQRYINGNGVETNRALGLYWISNSAVQGYSEAIDYRISLIAEQTK